MATPADPRMMAEDSNSGLQRVPEDAQLEVFEFARAKNRLKRLYDDWVSERISTERRRKLRNIEIDNKALRERGIIKSDESIVPIRLVDTNIRREQPVYIAFLKQSRRLAIFDCVSNPDVKTDTLEKDFTRGMSYDGWEEDHYRVLDGSQAHGWDAVEIVFDPTKPHHVAVEHIGHEHLSFGWDTKKIQDADVIIRTYEVAQDRLKEMVLSHGFNAEQVDHLIQRDQARYSDGVTTSNQEKHIQIHKRYNRWQGTVYVAWFSLNAQDWLKQPEKLYLGIDEQIIAPDGSSQWQPRDEKQYPIVVLNYYETEQKKITDKKGRAWLDEYKQEAMMGIWSAFLNGTQRASNVYGSPSQMTDAGGAAPQQTKIELKHGNLYSQPITFWGLPYPDPIMLKAAQALDTQNSQEVGQISYAVNNREDSRKTATEVSKASQDQALLSTVNVTLYSSFLRKVWTLSWSIVQNRAIQGLIPFCLKKNTDQMTGAVSWSNNLDTIDQLYDVRAAGDIDYVERQELLLQFQQDWPVIAATPLAAAFLGDYLRRAYREDGDRYAQMLAQGDPKKQVIQALGTALQGAVAQHPDVGPQEQQQLEQLKQETQNVLAMP